MTPHRFDQSSVRFEFTEVRSPVDLEMRDRPRLRSESRPAKWRSLRRTFTGKPDRRPGRGQGWGQMAFRLSHSNSKGGAGDGLRTRYLDLGKVALYQVSYSRSARRIDFTRPGLAGRSRRQRGAAWGEPAAPPISHRIHAHSGVVEPSSVE